MSWAKRARRTTRITLASVWMLLVPLPIAGCVTSGPTELPLGVTVSIQQNRADVAERRLQIVVTNARDSPLEVTAAEFASEQFGTTARWKKDSTSIPAQLTRDLPVTLPATECAAREPRPRVTIDFQTADGRSGEATVVPDDPFDRLTALRGEDCLRQEVDAIAEITAHRLPAVATNGHVSVATLQLAIAPAGGTGSLTIRMAIGTTLLATADPLTGARIESAQVDATVLGTQQSREVSLTFVPNRCDPHAIAEDKRGTIPALSVTVADNSGIIFIEPTAAVRSALIEFVQQACGLP